MIDDVICAKKTLWIRSCRIFAMKQNAQKRCCWHCNIWPITLLLISKLHSGVCEETFNVNIKIIIIQTTQNIWNFIVGKSSLQEMANFRRLSGRFHTLIWRPGDTVQNLESPGCEHREGIMQMGRYHFQILWTLPLQFLQDIFYETTKSTVKTLRGTLSWIKMYWFHHSFILMCC